jgi:hypothetical protein
MTVGNKRLLLNIALMEPTPTSPDAPAFPIVQPWPVLWKGIWAGLGLALLAALFTPLYKILTEAFSGPRLVTVLFEKDITELARFIGEFTTFLMYAAPVLAAVTGVWVGLQGLRALTQGRAVRWVGPAALAASAFIVFFVCQVKLSAPQGGLFFGKLMPKPAWGFYTEMVLLLAVVACGIAFAWLQRPSQPLASHE